MIYVPNHNNYNCIVYQSNHLRAYKQDPNINNVVDVDYIYFTNHYDIVSYKQNTSNWGTYECIPSNQVTDDYFYRHDITDILIFFTILLFFTVLIPIKIFSKLFKKGVL